MLPPFSWPEANGLHFFFRTRTKRRFFLSSLGDLQDPFLPRDEKGNALLFLPLPFVRQIDVALLLASLPLPFSIDGAPLLPVQEDLLLVHQWPPSFFFSAKSRFPLLPY